MASAAAESRGKILVQSEIVDLLEGGRPDFVLEELNSQLRIALKLFDRHIVEFRHDRPQSLHANIELRDSKVPPLLDSTHL